MRTKLLLLLLLANFSFYAQTNLIPNGNFETWSSSGPSSWFLNVNTIISQSSTAQNGLYSAEMLITESSNFINSTTFPIQANKAYRITMDYKPYGFSTVGLTLYHKPGTFKTELINKTNTNLFSSDWKQLQFDYVASITEDIEVAISATGPSGSAILLDNISVIEISEISEPESEYTLIPDINFENQLISLEFDSGSPNGKVLTKNIKNVTSLNISSSAINDLTGIQDFTMLTSLDISYNKIKTLDLSKNLNLAILNCSAGSNPERLIDLNVEKNVFLKELYCSGNNFTTLNLSKNILLEILVCNRTDGLLYVNLKNGNNKNLKSLSFTDQLMKCIQVDDVNYSNEFWSNYKYPATTFSLDCNMLRLETSVFDKVALYPNPTKGDLTITNLSLNKVTVYNSTGQLVKSFTLDTANTNNTISLSGLPKGIYYVYLINQDTASAKKVIVE